MEDRVKELIEGFCRWLEVRERSKKTVMAYRDRAERLIGYLKRHSIEIEALTPEKVDHYMYYLLVRKEHKAGTRSQVFYALKQFYNYLLRKGLIGSNPFDKATRIRKERRVKGCLTNDEVTLMIHAPGLDTEIGMRDTAIIAMLTALGTRATAICNLRLGDIKAEEITIPPKCSHCGQVDYNGHSRLKGKKKQVAIVSIREKGGKAWDIPINDKAAFYLNQYLLHREHYKESDIVFLCYRRSAPRPLNRHGLYSIVRKHALKAGIKGKVTPHSFRRAAITWLLDTGVDPIVVKNFFGHEALATTELYRHTTHRSFMWAGVAGERNLLEAIETPMDQVMERVGRD